MELEFDKEIDAILRRTSPDRGVLVGDDPPKKHLDADSISAFAENALPHKARLRYMEHFADCDRCRKQLSHTILMNSEADAASVFSAPVMETIIPWYTRLFKTQNLALAMGALVLTFSGVLGYLVLQNSRNSQKASVSQVTAEEEKRGEPFFGGEAATNSNTTVPSASPANTSAAPNLPPANTMANSSGIASPTAPATVGRLDADELKTAGSDDKALPLREVERQPKEAKPDAGAPPSPPPPAPVTMDSLSGGRAEKKLGAERQEAPKDSELAKRKQEEDRRSRDLPAAASKSGPARSGPLQNQSNQVQNKAFDMPVSRIVAGKTFNNRDGAWYDSTYRGQATTNYRRGTDAYTKLDRGLRNIADTLGGTVVVVWNSKAYRVQ